MRDIARIAGVSQSTVSRVLNEAPGFQAAPETRERVFKAAEDLGYRPNPLARGLRGAATMLIGAVVSDITDPFMSGAIEALSAAAGAHGYNLVLGTARDRAEDALALTTVLETRHCDAIILLGDIQDQPHLLEDLKTSWVPLVGAWQGSSPREMALVDVDNRAGIRACLEHLTSLGHRRIAFVSNRLLGDIGERHAAFMEFASEHLGPVPREYIQEVPITAAGGEQALLALFELRNPPTALVTASDTIAAGVYRAASTLGLRIPEDISVVGFDDIWLAAFMVPSLTTVRMPTAEIASAAVELAIELIRGPKRRKHRSRIVAPTLVVRESTGRPRPAVRRVAGAAAVAAAVQS